MSNRVEKFAHLFPSVSDGGPAPSEVTTPREIEIGRLGQSRLGATDSPVVPIPLGLPPPGSSDTKRLVDANVDPAIATTWSLVYLPTLNVVAAGDPFLGVENVTAANSIGSAWPAASGFPLGSQLLDGRFGRGLLELGQGGVRSGDMLFDIGAGGVAQVPAGSIQFAVRFPLRQFLYPAPPAPAYRAFIVPSRPSAPNTVLTIRVVYNPGVVAGTTTAIVVPVPIGARTHFLGGACPISGVKFAAGETGRYVVFSRKKEVVDRQTIDQDAGADDGPAFKERKLPADSVAVGTQFIGGAFGPVAVTFCFGMAW